MVERLAVNQDVAGSNPAPGAVFININWKVPGSKIKFYFYFYPHGPPTFEEIFKLLKTF